MARASEEGWDNSEPAFDTLPAHVGGDQQTVVADLLLELTMATTRLRILLSEADEDEYKAVKPRMDAFIDELCRIPTDPRKRTTIGFKVQQHRKKRRRS